MYNVSIETSEARRFWHECILHRIRMTRTKNVIGKNRFSFTFAKTATESKRVRPRLCDLTVETVLKIVQKAIISNGCVSRVCLWIKYARYISKMYFLINNWNWFNNYTLRDSPKLGPNPVKYIKQYAQYFMFFIVIVVCVIL